MVTISLLPHAELGANDHREDASHFRALKNMKILDSKRCPKSFKIREIELRLDILPQTMAKDLENIVDLDHELHKPSGVERKRKELENNQNSGIVIFQIDQQCIN